MTIDNPAPQAATDIASPAITPANDGTTPNDFVEDNGPVNMDEGDNYSDPNTDDNDADGAPPEDVEIEVDGKKYKVPAPLKDGFLRREDYTRKTQEVAEIKRSLDQMAQQHQTVAQEVVDAKVQHRILNDNVTQYENWFQSPAWINLQQQDPTLAQQHYLRYTQLKDHSGKAEKFVAEKEQEHALNQQRLSAKQIEEGRAVLARDIPDWSQELVENLVKHAVAKHGYTVSEAQSVTDPRIVKMIYHSFKADQSAKKQATIKRVEAVQSVTPAPVVRSNATTSTKDPAKMSNAQYREWRSKQNF